MTVPRKAMRTGTTRLAGLAAQAIACAAFVAAPAAVAAPGSEPSETLRWIAEQIRGEALLAPNGPAGRPLPLVSHWNMGSRVNVP